MVFLQALSEGKSKENKDWGECFSSLKVFEHQKEETLLTNILIKALKKGV